MRPATLIATGCGTAIATVCAFGLTQMQGHAPGVWSALAVVAAGALCLLLARIFGRLSTVVPSGAGLLAFVSRGLGRRAGIVIAVPYLLLTLFLVGVEATIAGTLVHRLAPVMPTAAGALVFLVGTWAFCRAGARIGFKAQLAATAALVTLLSGLAVWAIVRSHGLTLFAAPPSPLGFVAATGQALFLFMGFELLTAHAEQARPRAVDVGLTGTVALLVPFYALVALGVAALPAGDPFELLARAEGPLLPLGVLVCLLASFTSFNGALLGLSRFTAALAAQGALPRSLSKVAPPRLVPTNALNVLLVLAVAATALVHWGHALEPALLAAAVAAALLYAGAAWVREGAPFAEVGRSLVKRAAGRALAVSLVVLALGVLAGAGAGTLVLLGAAWAVAGLFSLRLWRPA
ncbi:MAG: APC family permease [Myxococcaceae bacterium]|nr:APC family permease [Myxococcaceae bacterium]